MADQNITELPIKTNSGVASTDYMLGIDSAEGYQILVRDVAKYIVENYNGSTLAGSAQTPKSAIDALNSKLETATITTAVISQGNDTVSITFPNYATMALIIVAQRPVFYTVGLYVNGYKPVVISASTNAPVFAVSSDYKTVTVSGLTGEGSVSGGKEIMVISTRQKPTISTP